MKYGITGTLDYSNINLYRASLSDNFKRFANPDLMSESIFEAKKEAEAKQFVNKGISKKSLNFVKNLQNIKTQNYSGIWYESGWYEKTPVAGIFFNYPHSSIIFNKNRLPYTTINSTGVYVDNIIWSGMEIEFDNENNVIGGFVDSSLGNIDFQNQTGLSPDFPYRNVFEIFDHKNKQVGDLGINMFINKNNLYSQNEEIGYNEIYFQSGLNKNNIDLATKILIFPSSKMIKNANFRTVNENNKRFNFKEKLNDPRFLVFFYTGNLNFNFIPLEQTQQILTGQANFGYGPILQLGNKNYGQYANQNYQINLSGIYPETFFRTFCIYNTGSVEVEGFAGISKEYSQVLNIENSNNISLPYIYTNENIHGIVSGEPINASKLTLNANVNYNLKITTTGLKDYIDSVYTAYVDIYKVTGYKKVGISKTPTDLLGFEYSGLLYDKKSFPVNIYLKNNQTKILKDDYFSVQVSGNKFASAIESNSIRPLSTSGFLDIKSRTFNLSFYSTGANVTSGPVKADLNKKLFRQAEYSNTGIYSGLKHIYPILSGESYLYAKADVNWIDIKNPNQNFKYVTGFTGNFINNNYNPLAGSITQDLIFQIDEKKLLPDYENTGSSNFVVTISGNKYLFNDLENINHLIVENKKYRFFNTGSQIFDIVNKPVDIYEAEYNKKTSNQYRIVEMNATLKNRIDYEPISGVSNSTILWSGIFGTGTFDIRERKKRIYYSGDNNNEWFIFSIQPDWSIKTKHLQTSGEADSLIKSINYTGLRGSVLNSVRFYPDLLNIEILNSKDDSFSKNICNSGNNKFWRIKQNNTTGCYTDAQAIEILSKQFNAGISNPVLQLETGKNYHFLRVAGTQLEITGTTLQFEENTIPYSNEIYTNVQFNNFRRITNLNNSNLSTGFFKGSGKYFEYINFYVQPELTGDRLFNYQPSGFNRISNLFKIIDSNYLEPIEINDSKYYEKLTKPIFSGNIEVYTSDISNNKIILPIVLSGVNNIGYLKF